MPVLRQLRRTAGRFGCRARRQVGIYGARLEAVRSNENPVIVVIVLQAVRHASCSAQTDQGGAVIAVPEVRRFIADAMRAVGTASDRADLLAEVLVEADYRGHYSHGLNRLGRKQVAGAVESPVGQACHPYVILSVELYVDDVSDGSCAATADPIVLRETAATAWVDGGHGLGPVVGRFSMELAISKAKETGVGWVVAKGELPIRFPPKASTGSVSRFSLPVCRFFCPLRV